MWNGKCVCSIIFSIHVHKVIAETSSTKLIQLSSRWAASGMYKVGALLQLSLHFISQMFKHLYHGIMDNDKWMIKMKMMIIYNDKNENDNDDTFWLLIMMVVTTDGCNVICTTNDTRWSQTSLFLFTLIYFMCVHVNKATILDNSTINQHWKVMLHHEFLVKITCFPDNRKKNVHPLHKDDGAIGALINTCCCPLYCD